MSIIDVVTVDKDQKPISAAEKQELFAAWAKRFKTPIWFFENLGSLIDLVAIDNEFMILPELIILRIRKLCYFPSIVPIIAEDPVYKFSRVVDRKSKSKPEP